MQNVKGSWSQPATRRKMYYWSRACL